jgi:predicted permease
MALGYAAGRFNLFSRDDFRVLGSFVARFALPALVFTALSRQPVARIADARFLVDYAVGSFAVLAIGMGWGYLRQGKRLTLSALSGLGMASSNSGYIGYPIVALLFGPELAAVGLALCMLVENLLVIPTGLVLADSGAAQEGAWHQALVGAFGRFARTPLFLGIVAGFVVALAEIPVPEPLAKSINLLALASTATALFVVGGSLVGLEVKGMRRDAGAIALGKLVLHPLAVGLMVFLWPPADPMLRTAAVVFAAMPMLSIYPIFAQKFGYESLCAAALLLATVASFATIALLLWILGAGLGWSV